jgi:hypothetical protein
MMSNNIGVNVVVPVPIAFFLFSGYKTLSTETFMPMDAMGWSFIREKRWWRRGIEAIVR